MRVLRPLARPAAAAGAIRLLSTTRPTHAHRALVFRAHGALDEALTAQTFRALPQPAHGQVNVRVRLAPVNPSDVNVVEGVYPNKPEAEVLVSPHLPTGGGERDSVYVPGNEGVAEVTEVGEGVCGLQVGDWVVFAKAQPGTWSSAQQVGERDVIRVKKDLGDAAAAMLSVNPPTALSLLREFVQLKEGDWIVQNGANSAVGQLVIQIAAQKGFRTLNFVRSRPEGEQSGPMQHLTSLGATHVHTYDELSDRAFVQRVKELTVSNPPRLLLNCVSGPSTTALLRLLGAQAHLVSYGAMSKQPLHFPTGLFIFKDLTARGFWMSRWYEEHTREEREALLKEVAGMKLAQPAHRILTVEKGWSDEEAGRRVREVLGKAGRAASGEKVLLRIEDPEV